MVPSSAAPHPSPVPSPSAAAAPAVNPGRVWPASMRAKAAVVLLASATLGHLLVYLFGGPKHVVDPTWLPHARVHMIQALGWTFGLDLFTLALAVGPLRLGQRWAYWALVFAFPFVHLGYFIGMAAIEDGGSDAFGTFSVTVMMTQYLLGLAAGWKARF
jgi:hypothetical protein